MTQEEFIYKAKQIHGDKYDYSKVEYMNNHTKICIICPDHGEFLQSPNHHLRGAGCPKCANIKHKLGLDAFIQKAKNIHGNKYIYNKDKINYVNNHTKICITCPVHGDFWQTPSGHLRGWGCSLCAKSQKQVSYEEFLYKAIKKHGNKYTYVKESYNGLHKKMDILCPIHGMFHQTPEHHLRGNGCSKCFIENRTKTTEDYITECKKIHGNNYVYTPTQYIGAQHKVAILCPKHGIFYQRAEDHKRGYKCPKCSDNNFSKSEKELADFILSELKIPIEQRNRTLLDGLEIDVLIPSHKIAIEFNGLYWHSEACIQDKNYHLHKTEIAESKGYHLIHIFEDEWLEHKDLVLSKVRHFLGCDTDKPVIGARKCVIKTLSKPLAEPFLTTYHLQGFVASTAYYGAFYGDILVGVMTFKQEKPNMWNLTRFATNTDYRLPGLANKVFKQFVKDNNPTEVKTFLDRRWGYCGGNVYDKMGFELIETLLPDYKYVVRKQRVHKFNFRKHILSKKYNLPLTMTEKEMAEQLGFYRIWDCGLYKYVWKPSNSV